MLLSTVLSNLNAARSRGDIASALNMASSFLTRCCVLRFDFEGHRYELYPTEVEAYCHNQFFPDPFTHCHDLQRHHYEQLYFHASGMDLCLSDSDTYLSFLIRSAYVICDGRSELQEETGKDSAGMIPVVGPLRLKEKIFGHRSIAVLQDMPIASQQILFEADPMTSPDRFYTMISSRVGLVRNVDPYYADLRLRTVSDTTMRGRDYRPKEELLDSYLAIVRLTPEERYKVIRQLVDRCPSKYMPAKIKKTRPL